ncbi:MAG TPA: hypothetical protein PK597_04350 [Oscillospiraceae bacterium]|nr:hypothetical protein [Oscillospiraceae bacterium]
MIDPLVGGISLSLLILYFLFYSFLGWAMETLYCSIGEKRFVARGFLYGPVCPIYGVGALIMILPLSHLKGNLPLFFAVSVVCLSAWEYFVGWLLDVTTHIKYWDYSTYRFNLGGYICLQNSLAWGVLAYAAVFFIHPAVAGALAPIAPELRRNVAVFFSGVILVDFGVTVRELALLRRLMDGMEKASEDLRRNLTEDSAELRAILEERGETLREAAEERKLSFLTHLDELTALAAENTVRPSEASRELRERYTELVRETEEYGHRFFNHYRRMTSRRYRPFLQDVRDRRARLREQLEKLRQTKK